MSMRMWIRFLTLLSGSWSGIATPRNVRHQSHGSDPVWLWWWHRPAAVALTPTLGWELPHAGGTAVKNKIYQDNK